MTLSREFLAELRLLEGEDGTLNHIPADSPKLTRLRELALGSKRKHKQFADDVVRITFRGKKYLEFEDVDWRLIKQCREDYGMEQKEMANRIGVKLYMYQRYELGTARITRDRLVEVCDVLGLTVKERREVKPRLNVKVELLANKRQTLNIAQHEVAKVVGVSRSKYSKLENGVTAWDKDKLKVACKVLGIKYEDVTV